MKQKILHRLFVVSTSLALTGSVANTTPLSCDAIFLSGPAKIQAPIVEVIQPAPLHPAVVTALRLGTQASTSSVTALKTLREKIPFLPPPREKSPLEPKPLPVRVVTNLNRWYFQKDTRQLSEPTVDMLTDRDYIQSKRNDDKLGLVRSFFSKKFDTRIYYVANAVPDANGVIPPVNPKARALFIYLHGSGTNKASGANFAYKMNKLARLGYASLAIDLPYHSDGSRNRAMLEPTVFYANLKTMIDEYRVPGQPVYLAGHSFGPDLAAELIKRYPFEVDGVLMISPGSFNDVMEDWFMNHTSKMTALWGDIISNDDGAAWAGVISSKHTWRLPPTPLSPDPTIVNPKLKVRVLTGAWEEYVPGELDERGLPTKTDRDYNICGALTALLSRAVCTIEPKVGHYIFEHRDENGNDVILREMLAIDGQDIAHEKELRDSAPEAKLTEMNQFAIRFVRDPFFNAFVTAQVGGWKEVKKIVDADDLVAVRKLLNDFSRVTPQRDRALVENLQATKVWSPAFYAENSTEIDLLDPKKPRVADALANKYLKMVEAITPQQTAAFASADKDVLRPPERTGPPPHILEQMQRQQQEYAEKAAAKARAKEKARQEQEQRESGQAQPKAS